MEAPIMIDSNDNVNIEKRLRNAANALHAMTGDVAIARQIREFSSDRRKAILAEFTVPFLQDNSSAAAETMARATPAYLDRLETLEAQYRDAEKAIATWSATVCTFDAARSLMSMSKEQLRQI